MTTHLRPTLDALEPRDLLSGGISQIGHSIYIRGSSFADQAVVRLTDFGTADPHDERVVVQLTRMGQSYQKEFMKYDIRRIVFTGGNGNDRFQDFTPLPSVARGGRGDDTLVGGPEDRLLGGAGDNTILPAPAPGTIQVQEGKSQSIWNEEGQYREYRIRCTLGRLIVTWTDASGKDREEKIEAGQSIDVRGDRVSVIGDDAGENSGTYERL